MSWGAIAAAAIGVVGGAINANSAKKNAGKVAAYEPVDYTSVQRDAIQGNLANSSSIEALLARGNAFNADQALSLQNQTMPGYSALAKSLTSRAQGLADNPYDVPKEVEDNIARISAERGISAGTRGQFNDFSLLRDFGVNSLQYGESNLNQAKSITGLLATIAPKVNPMSPMSFYVTPSQREATITNNNTQSQAIAQGAINAANAATNAGNANMLASLTQIAGMYGGTRTGTAGNTAGTVYDVSTPSNPEQVGIVCWVARSVYGAENPAWTEFREVMLTEMPRDFVDFYIEHGPKIAADIEDKPEIKTLIRGLMDEIRKSHTPAHT